MAAAQGSYRVNIECGAAARGMVACLAEKRLPKMNPPRKCMDAAHIVGSAHVREDAAH